MAGIFELLDSLDQAHTMSVALPSGGVTEGEVLQVGSTFGFVFATVSESTNANEIQSQPDYTLVYRARKVRVNKDNEACSQGGLAYWDGAQVSATSTGGDLIGEFIEDASASDSTAVIDMDGTLTNLD